MLLVQERELEAAWFIKRIHYRIMCVWRWYTNGVIGNPSVTIQGPTFVSTTNFLLMGGEGTRPCRTVVCVAMCVTWRWCIHVFINWKNDSHAKKVVRTQTFRASPCVHATKPVKTGLLGNLVVNEDEAPKEM